MIESIKEFISSIDEQNLIYFKVISIALITALISFLSREILLRLETKFTKTKTLWDDTILFSIRKPLRLLIWVYGISIASKFAFNEMQIEVTHIVDKVQNVTFIVFLSWSLLRLISKIEAKYRRKRSSDKKLDETTLDAICKLLRITVIISSVLIALQTLGFSISAVLAFGGVGGLAVGLAAKDLLSNFFGAFVIYVDKPFGVGDWIRSPDKEIEGTVEKIGWRQTVIRTFDKRPLYVPNSLFNNIIVENPSRMDNRRIYEHIGIRYDDINNIEKITQQVEEMLKNHEEIDIEKTLMVNVNKFSDSSVDFFIYTFTKTTNWQKFHQIKQDIMLKISNIIEDNNSEFAFPTRTLNIPDELAKEISFNGKN